MLNVGGYNLLWQTTLSGLSLPLKFLNDIHCKSIRLSP